MLSHSDLNNYTSLSVDPRSCWRAQNSRLALRPSLSRAHVKVEFTFTLDFGHALDAAFTMCGDPNKVFTTDNSPQLTFRFIWLARL